MYSSSSSGAFAKVIALLETPDGGLKVVVEKREDMTEGERKMVADRPCAPYVNKEGANEVSESQAHDSPTVPQSPLVPRRPIMYPLVCVIVLQRLNEATSSDIL